MCTQTLMLKNISTCRQEKEAKILLKSGLTLEHSSVAKYLAMEHRATFSDQSSSRARAAILTMLREVTSLVAMSARVN